MKFEGIMPALVTPLNKDETINTKVLKELIEYQLMRYMKGYIAVGAYLNIGNAENYDYWEYTTSDGTAVVLLSSPEKSVVIADYENSLLSINILGSYSGNDFSDRAALEAFAETFDFSVID